VERKGKLLRLVLERMSTNNQDSDPSTASSQLLLQEKVRKHEEQKEKENKLLHLYFHMGMTGRISCPDNIPSLESLTTSESFPPPHTHLILKVKRKSSSSKSGHGSCGYTTLDSTSNHNDDLSCIAFSDPRRFGAVSLGEPLSVQWDELAEDALMHNSQHFIQNIHGQKKGIKSLLLDQRAVVSGVGNWIADEILYQCEIHPDQRFLTLKEATALSICLNKVLKTGIECLSLHQDYPLDWLFHHRWNKGKGGVQKDFKGKTIAYIQSGGRTSAIVPAVQKIKSSRKESNKEEIVKENPTTKKKPALNNRGKEWVKEKTRLEDDQVNIIRRSKRIAKCEHYL
jgi:formamidopyrimidine-DNA glycosylase